MTALSETQTWFILVVLKFCFKRHGASDVVFLELAVMTNLLAIFDSTLTDPISRAAR
jgi:hypothetical protein